MPKISIRTLLLTAIAVAIPLALHRSIPVATGWVVVFWLAGIFAAWTGTGASFGNDNGRTLGGALVGLALFAIWAIYMLIPVVKE